MIGLLLLFSFEIEIGEMHLTVCFGLLLNCWCGYLYLEAF